MTYRHKCYWYDILRPGSYLSFLTVLLHLQAIKSGYSDDYDIFFSNIGVGKLRKQFLGTTRQNFPMANFCQNCHWQIWNPRHSAAEFQPTLFDLRFSTYATTHQ